MKIQLDTQNKTIKVEGMIKLCDLIKHLETLLPEGSLFGSYKEYSIDCNATIQWYSYPVIVNPQQNWWDNLPVYNPSPLYQTVNCVVSEAAIHPNFMTPTSGILVGGSPAAVNDSYHIFNFTLN